MSASDRFRELCAGLQVGGLEPAELHELEALLRAGGEEEWRLFGEIEAAALHLAASAPPVDPPARLRGRLQERLKSGTPGGAAGAATRLAERLGLGRPRRALAAVATLLALLAAAGVLGTVLYDRASRAEAHRAQLEAEIGRGDSLLDVLRSRQVEMVVLDGLESRPDSHGKVLWDAAASAGILQLSGLPPTPAGKVYQLWVFPRGGEPWSAGAFELGASAHTMLFRLDDFVPGAVAGLNGFLVTLEDGAASEPGDDWLLGARLEEPTE